MVLKIGEGALVPSLTTRGLLGSGEGAESSQAGRSFQEELKLALREVNRLQGEASRQNQLLATGEAKDLHSVVIAAEKASIAFQLTLQIRNKALEAYQEIMRMQV